MIFFLLDLIFFRELIFDVIWTVAGATMKIFEAEVGKNAIQKLHLHSFITSKPLLPWN